MKTQLAIDTASEYCVVGLKVAEALYTKQQKGFKSHAAVILSFIECLLSEAMLSLADVDTVVFSQGPGSFTGLRIAACVAQGLAESHSIPVIGLSTLNILAQRVYREFGDESVWVLNDARMSQVYHGQFQLRQGFMQAVSSELVQSMADINWQDMNRWRLAGSGLALYPEFMPCNAHLREIDICGVTLQDMFELANYQKGRTAQTALPSYVRNQVTF